MRTAAPSRNQIRRELRSNCATGISSVMPTALQRAVCGAGSLLSRRGAGARDPSALLAALSREVDIATEMLVPFGEQVSAEVHGAAGSRLSGSRGGRDRIALRPATPSTSLAIEIVALRRRDWTARPTASLANAIVRPAPGRDDRRDSDRGKAMACAGDARVVKAIPRVDVGDRYRGRGAGQDAGRGPSRRRVGPAPRGAGPSRRLSRLGGAFSVRSVRHGRDRRLAGVPGRLPLRRRRPGNCPCCYTSVRRSR